MSDNETLRVLFRTIPVPTGIAVLLSAPTVFWMRPPVHVGVAEVQTPALPVTVRPAVAPVVFNTIPFAAPLAEILRNVRPLAPMLVLATFSAVPVVVAIVFTIVVLFCVAVTVPPPVAVNAGLVVVVRLNPP